MATENQTTQVEIPKDASPVVRYFYSVSQKNKPGFLRDNPGARVRIFDALKGQKFSDICGVAGKAHVAKAREMAGEIKPPYTKETVEKAFKEFEKLDNDIINSPGFEEFVASIVPKGSENYDLIRADIISAYRFKILTTTTYSPDRNVNARLQDFYQLMNTQYRTDPSPEKAFENIIENTKQELRDAVLEDIKNNASADQIVKNIIARKQYEYLGSDVNELVKEAIHMHLANQSKDLNPTALEAIQRTLEEKQRDILGKLKQCKEAQEELKTILSDKDAPPDDCYNKAKKVMDKYSNSLSKETQDTILSNAISKTSEPLYSNLQGELLKEIVQSGLKNNELPANQLIDNIRAHSMYSQVDQKGNHAVKILLKEIDNVGAPDRKTALMEDIHRRANLAATRALGTTMKPEQKMEELLNDKYISAFMAKGGEDKEKLSRSIVDKIAALPVTKDFTKDDKTKMLQIFNETTGNNLSFPKSKLQVFAEKVVTGFNKVGNLVRSGIKSFFSGIKSIATGRSGRSSSSESATESSMEQAPLMPPLPPTPTTSSTITPPRSVQSETYKAPTTSQELIADINSQIDKIEAKINGAKSGIDPDTKLFEKLDNITRYIKIKSQDFNPDKGVLTYEETQKLWERVQEVREKLIAQIDNPQRLNAQNSSTSTSPTMTAPGPDPRPSNTMSSSSK